ncbi:uncharacterized protein NPIL_668771 [Nephila pilipes]|uniref:Uncharacterized protein n=1 Tax=Nephila pilipes TaxID=299642 RepID=A0A8X6NVR8_NEPPI|nr:uncharacterized protein NPIL_668771 [Nephila pilipes]
MDSHVTSGLACRSCHPLDSNSRLKICDCAFTTPILRVPKTCYSHGSAIGHHSIRNTCCHGVPAYKWLQEKFPHPPLDTPECNKACQEIRMKPLDLWLPHCKYEKPTSRKDFYVVHVCECYNPSKVLQCARFA